MPDLRPEAATFPHSAHLWTGSATPRIWTMNLEEIQSAAAAGALQNLAAVRAPKATRQRLGVRRCSAAFGPRVDFEFRRFVERAPTTFVARIGTMNCSS